MIFVKIFIQFSRYGLICEMQKKAYVIYKLSTPMMTLPRLSFGLV